MKLIGVAFGIACTVAVVGAQEIKTTTKEKTKVEIKDGKDVKVAGCLTSDSNGGYVLVNDLGEMKYLLVTDENFSKYIGRQVEVKGIATDRGAAKVKVESTVGTKGEVDGQKIDDSKRKTTTVSEGDIAMRYLGVQSIKKLSEACRH